MCICILRGIVQCEEKLTISASWSKDEDISRLLQSLPNWANMAQPRQTRQKREDEEDFTRCVHESTQIIYEIAHIYSHMSEKEEADEDLHNHSLHGQTSRKEDTATLEQSDK